MLDAQTIDSCTLIPRPLDVDTLETGDNIVTFVSKTMGGDLKLAGLLFLPEGFDPSRQYPSVVLSGAFNQVKEQTCAVYGRKFAQQGYVALSFDHQGYGDSEGCIRRYEYTPARIEGIQDAVSFLRMQGFVDRERLFGVGICAGGSHMALTAVTDKRLKKIAVVGGMLVNTLVQFTANGRKKALAMLESANEARQQWYETGKTVPFDALGFDDGTAEKSKIADQRERTRLLYDCVRRCSDIPKLHPQNPRVFRRRQCASQCPLHR